MEVRVERKEERKRGEVKGGSNGHDRKWGEWLRRCEEEEKEGKGMMKRRKE